MSDNPAAAHVDDLGGESACLLPQLDDEGRAPEELWTAPNSDGESAPEATPSQQSPEEQQTV